MRATLNMTLRQFIREPSFLEVAMQVLAEVESKQLSHMVVDTSQFLFQMVEGK